MLQPYYMLSDSSFQCYQAKESIFILWSCRTYMHSVTLTIATQQYQGSVQHVLINDMQQISVFHTKS